MRRFLTETRKIACTVLLLGAVGVSNGAFGQGKVVGWGDNDYGQIDVPNGLRDVVSVSAGEFHSMALNNSGEILEWGSTVGYPCFPMRGALPPATPLIRAKAISEGGFHRLAVATDGTVYGWGDNCFGQASPPPGLTGATAVAGGYLHSLALKSDGTVVGWGDNYYGEATPPAGLSGVRSIAAGWQYSLALKSDGTVVGWGNNNYGQATPPAGLKDVVAIAAGSFYPTHSLALKSDGTVVGWGNNDYGQAAPPAGLSGVVAIAAGGNHSLALKSDGTVIGWGDNSQGQAIPPADLSGAVAVTGGGGHSLAVVGRPCRVDIRLTYLSDTGTLKMLQTIGTTEPSNLYQSWLVSARGATLLTRKQLPAIDPPHTFQKLLPLPPMGSVGVLGTLYSLADLTMCYDLAVADTGGVGPTASELQEILRKSGLLPAR